MHDALALGLGQARLGALQGSCCYCCCWQRPLALGPGQARIGTTAVALLLLLLLHRTAQSVQSAPALGVSRATSENSLGCLDKLEHCSCRCLSVMWLLDAVTGQPWPTFVLVRTCGWSHQCFGGRGMGVGGGGGGVHPDGLATHTMAK